MADKLEKADTRPEKFRPKMKKERTGEMQTISRGWWLKRTQQLLL